MEWMAILMFVTICLVLLLGYPVAFSLAGTALIFAGIGSLMGGFDTSLLMALPSRIYGVMTNQTLLAVPLFVFMGVMLEKSKIAEDLLTSMTQVFGRLPAGLGIAVTLVGALMAASTGIVGATVVTMGLLALPSMQKNGYNESYSTGVIAATGTLGQIIPPSIALVLLGDVLSSAYQQSQLSQGIFSPETISVGDLFAGALIPGLILVAMYLLYSLMVGLFKPEWTPPADKTNQLSIGALISSLVPPLALMVIVLGSSTLFSACLNTDEQKYQGLIKDISLTGVQFDIKSDVDLSFLKEQSCNLVLNKHEFAGKVCSVRKNASSYQLGLQLNTGEEQMKSFMKEHLIDFSVLD